MLKVFCMNQKLRTFFTPDRMPPGLETLISAWDRLQNDDIRGTRLGDSFTFDESFREVEEKITWSNEDLKRLSRSWFTSLSHWIKTNDACTKLDKLSPFAYMRTEMARLGEKYQTMETSQANSHIYYRDFTSTIHAGAIAGIFSHTRFQQDGSKKTQTFIAVNQYKPLPRDKAHGDHYCKFPTVAGKVYQNAFYEGITVISSNDLLYHFAAVSVEIPSVVPYTCVLALPLDKS